jgi:hypothetical protein
MSPAHTTAASLPEGVTDVLVTHLLTTTVDPQRNVFWEPDPSQFSGLFDSAAEHGVHIVLIHDADLTGPVPHNVTAVRVEPTEGDVYWRRWDYTLEWLYEHPEVQHVFCVDGSDVTVLRDPFVGLDEVTLYVGSELTFMSDPWMLREHPHPRLQQFFQDNAGRRIYNAGIVGGTRGTVKWFVEDMVVLRRGWSLDGDIGSDMGLLNYVALLPTWTAHIETGPTVHTIYKRYETSHPTARFAHK